MRPSKRPSRRLGRASGAGRAIRQSETVHRAFEAYVVRPFRSLLRLGPRRSSEVHNGFTLIEILVVIVVIGLLAALVAPNVFRHIDDAKTASARSQIEMFVAALDTYRLDNGQYPASSQGLEALRREPLSEPRPRAWRGPYLRREIPLDPWGNAFVYRSPGEANPWSFDLLSYGADGQAGGTGDDADITSWQ